MSACDRVDLDPESGAPDLIRLVEGIASRASPFPKSAVNRYVDRLFDEAWASERELALWEKLPRDECLRYSNPDEPITLDIVRRIAFRLEVSIVEVLDSAHPTIQSFGFASEAPLPIRMQPGRKTRTIDRTSLARQLRAVLEDPSEPMSLRHVARRLSVSVGAIRYHYPGLATQLVNRCAAFKEAEASRKRSAAANVVKTAMLSRAGAGPPTAKKTLLRDLLQKTGLPKNLLMAEIRAQWGA